MARQGTGRPKDVGYLIARFLDAGCAQLAWKMDRLTSAEQAQSAKKAPYSRSTRAGSGLAPAPFVRRWRGTGFPSEHTADFRNVGRRAALGNLAPQPFAYLFLVRLVRLSHRSLLARKRNAAW